MAITIALWVGFHLLIFAMIALDLGVVHKVAHAVQDALKLHDVQKRLAWLSAYLGHDDLLGTQDYLQLTPELRRIVSSRHEDYISCCWDLEA